MDIFVEVLNKKLWGKSFFCVIIPKQKLFWRIADTLFQILRKNLQKQNFRQISFDLGQLELLEVSREQLGAICLTNIQ